MQSGGVQRGSVSGKTSKMSSENLLLGDSDGKKLEESVLRNLAV